jgi:hypothetical protein
VPIPCPIHMPQAWAIYRSKSKPWKVDWSREAEIARGCCANCEEGEGSDSPSLPTEDK